MLDRAALSSIWNVPYRQNPFFTGGEEILNHLHKDLQKERVAALSQPQGISGLGGIGKTQIALEYVYRYHTDYEAVLWVRADSASTLTSEFVAVAQVLALPERDKQDQSVIVEAVLRWLRRQAGWLLILDNADNLTAVEPFVPKAGRGHIILTTRAHSLGVLAHRIELQKMEPETGALFLLRRASLLPLQTSLEMANGEERSWANKISQVLDGLPLALDQAGAYIKETSCGLQEYLERFQTRRRELLRSRGSLEKDYPGSVATTWSLSFEKVAKANPAAAELLDFCAFLSPDAIPEEMITGEASYLGPLLQPVAADPLLFDQLVAALLAYSLIARNADDNLLSIHRLVQVVLQDAMGEDIQQEWIKRAIKVVHQAVPSGELGMMNAELWSQSERLLPHARACAALSTQWNYTFPEVSSLLIKVTNYLWERGQYVEAKPLSLRALAIREQVFGPEHPDVAESLSNIALLYWYGGEYKEAETLLERSLAIYERSVGATHPLTARCLSNLAMFYRDQGKYEKAEKLILRALPIFEQAFGSIHRDTAASLNNLAALYWSQERYAEAEPLLKRALAIREQLSGAVHPDTASNLNNLAEIYRMQGRYAEAEPLLKRALAIREQVSGPIHPDTANSLNTLAALYWSQGKDEETEPLLKRALAIREQVLGPSHPDTANIVNNLGVLYRNQRKYEEAELYLQHALMACEQSLGMDHPLTKKVVKNIERLNELRKGV